jgi:cytochrome c oxidase assembly protein subunit 20
MVGPVLICSNYAVAAWCVTGCVHYQVCQYYRRKEKDGMKQAAELMEKKRATIEARKEARRKQREEHERLEEARRLDEERKKSWGYWVNKNVRFW